jgi:tripartite-type tricarboxylate transporter receptor subunit TctC
MRPWRSIAALAAAAALGAFAQFPQKNITIVVPFTPGTGADLIARVLQPRMSADFKVPIVVDNKAGASGAIGTQAVADAPHDGYTLLFTATSHGTVPALRANLPYDPARSFVPVALTATSAMAFVVSPRLGVRSFDDFVRQAKRSPGQLNYSSPGNGSIQHLAMELVKLETGMDVVHVPYKGSSGAVTDLVGGEVQATVAAVQTVAPFVKTGRLRMLAVLSEERSPAFPDVPTMKELGHPSLVVDTWYGLFAPAGTSRAAVDKINTEVNAILRRPEARAALERLGMTPVTDRPERLGRLVDEELARWKRVVEQAGIQGD